MAHSESERYYESEKNLPKIDQSDFCINPNFDVTVNTDILVNHLKSLEPIYHEHIVANNGKPDSRVCNEIWFSCVQLYGNQFDLCEIYNEIIDYFDFINEHFYNSLNSHFKRSLKEALSKRVSLDTFERQKLKEEVSQGGSFTPSFAMLLKKK